MFWSTSVLTSISSDTEPSFIISFPTAKYIFNVGENSIRSFIQSGRFWRKTRALFLTQASIEKVAGFPGMAMTFGDGAIDDLQLIGPPGVTHMLASMRFFTYRDSISIKPTEVPFVTSTGSNPIPCYADENIQVYSIPILPCIEKIDIPMTNLTPEQLLPSNNVAKRKREPSEDSPRKRLNNPSTPPRRISDALLAAFSVEGFRPEHLTGNLAEEYRRHIVTAMFPHTRKKMPVEGKNQRCRQNNSFRNSSGKSSENRPTSASMKEDINDYKRRESRPKGFNKRLPKHTKNLPQSKAPPAFCYIIVGPRFRGKFDGVKAVKLGIPSGPLRAALTKGETITFEIKEGDEVLKRTVHPEDVIGPSDPAGAIAILDVPSVAQISSLVSSFNDSEFYQKFFYSKMESNLYNLRIIYHMCGNGVLEDERYKSFMNNFGPETTHIIASREFCPDPVTFTSSALSQLRWNRVDENLFPIIKHSLTPKKDINSVLGLPSKILLMSANLHTVMRPYTPPGPDPAVILRDKFHPVMLGTEPLVLSPTIENEIKTAKDNISLVKSRQSKELIKGADVGIIPLGTGASLPSKYRNVLSTLIRIPDWGNILLDAGEGTWGQLARNFGLDNSPYNVWQALRDLKCIFISHIHADHHVGLAQILAKRILLDPPPSSPLYIVSIKGVHLYLRELSDVHDLGMDDPSGNGVISILNESIHLNANGAYQTEGMWSVTGDEPWLDFKTSTGNAERLCDSLGLKWLNTVDVHHGCRAFGVAFGHRDGWSMTFSGDTRPSTMLGRLGENTTVLIHEASMADDEAELADQKGHSTVGQAIEMGRRMNAKNVLLTHFSARYAKYPPYIYQKGDASTFDSKATCIVPAFDHLNLTIGDIWKLQFYLPCLYQIASGDSTVDEDEDDENISIHPQNVSLA